MSAHTPTPWRAIESPDLAEHVSLHGQDGLPICRMGGNFTYVKAAANAAHIVKCVNAHDELVEIVRALLENSYAVHPDEKIRQRAVAALAKVQS